MRNLSKLLLGLLTVLPLIYLILFALGLMQAFYVTIVRDSWGALMYRWIGFSTLFRLNLLFMAWLFVLAIIYLINVIRNNRLSNEIKLVWAVLIISVGVFSMPTYWYLNIWRARRVAIQALS